MDATNTVENNEWDKFIQNLSCGNLENSSLGDSCFDNNWDIDVETQGQPSDPDQWLNIDSFLDQRVEIRNDQSQLPSSSVIDFSDQGALATLEQLPGLATGTCETELKSRVEILENE